MWGFVPEIGYLAVGLASVLKTAWLDWLIGAPASPAACAPCRAQTTTSSDPPWACAPCRAQTTTSSETAAKDRKSTRLNSSHANISYAVFCLKKKNITHSHDT